jgi:phosphatidylserine decarboxylase
MKIAVYAWKFIILGLAAAGAGGALWHLKGLNAGLALAVLGLLFAAFCAYFFRDPERPLPTDSSKIYSSGDGVIMSVAKEGSGETVTVRTFLSVFDVHIQRLPCSGKVEKVEYKEGSFVAAMKQPESFANERNIVSIACEGRGTIVVEQIAGLIARRIRCWVGAGDSAVAGERYGLIQFGSQAAIHLPEGAVPLVKPGDRVVGGVTPVAEWIERN